MAGLVANLRQLFTKKKTTMLVATLEDIHGTFEVVAFPRTYERSRALWQEDAILIVKGKVDARGEDRLQVIVDEVSAYAPGGALNPAPPAALSANGAAPNGSRTSAAAAAPARAVAPRPAAPGAAGPPPSLSRPAPATRRHHLHVTMRRGETPDGDMD